MQFALAIAAGCNLKMRVQNALSIGGQNIEKLLKTQMSSLGSH